MTHSNDWHPDDAKRDYEVASGRAPSATLSEDSSDATARMLPCPSCGETDVDATFAAGVKGGEREERFYNAGCMVCGMTGPDSHTAQDAADRWNALPRTTVSETVSSTLRADLEEIRGSALNALRRDETPGNSQLNIGTLNRIEQIAEAALKDLSAPSAIGQSVVHGQREQEDYRRALEAIIADPEADAVAIAHAAITPYTPWIAVDE